MSRLRLGILISGRGSNMEQLLKAASAPDYPAQPAIVVSNKTDAEGLSIASSMGVPVTAIPHKQFDTREAFEQALDGALRDADVEILALAGFMRVLTPWFVSRWQGRMLNIHPSLLPKYPGLDTHARAIEAEDEEAGCSVHWVTEGVDEGAVIAQARVPIRPDDTPQTLADRVLIEEHGLYPHALAMACERLSKKPSS